MMREIKFKGKTVITNEWIYGDLIHRGEETYILSDEKVDSVDRYQVDQETVGQLTGLKDDYGVDIYEGDILAVPELYETPEMTPTNYINWQVVFVHGAFNLSQPGYEPGVDSESLFQEYESYDARFTVLGNIHDNADLLSYPFKTFKD